MLHLSKKKSLNDEVMEAVIKSHGDENFLVMADMDAVIKKCVNDIWHEYDTNNDGILDREETKQFVRATLQEMNDGNQFTESDFKDCFKAFDKDDSGAIEKSEMVTFIWSVIA